MRTAATFLVALVGALAALPAVYLLVLALAAAALRSAPRPRLRPEQLAVLVPAHDEAELIDRCVRSLLAQSYPRGSFSVIVVADNCRDETANIARAAGAEVMVRDEPGARGKGHALRWAIDRILASTMPLDALVVVDADSIADPDLLWELEAERAAGAEVVQADYLVLHEDRSPQSELVGLAFLLFHRVRFGGRKMLGLPASLVGNGMLFTRSVLERQPWRAFTGAEDLEYSIQLRMAGVRPAFAPAARIYGPVPARKSAVESQRLRWEGGRFLMVRRWLVRLVAEAWRRHDWGLLDAAMDLAVPPFGLLFVGVVCGLALATAVASAGLVAIGAPLIWLVAAAAMVGYVTVGLRAAGAPSSSYLTLLRLAPVYLVRKMAIYMQILRGDGLGAWVRTQRPGETSPEPDRMWLAGVPIDPVTMPVAVDRILGAVGSGRMRQVCTVNLDFLVRAQTNNEIARILARADMNVADGAPVVWLSRLTGNHVPGRIAGADLVPQMMAAAATRGASVFLLGGQDGVAQKAGAALQARHPNLRIAGVHEPPLMSGAIEDDHIVGLVNASRADILIVALGHPKQELWIDRNRDRLRVSVAIGAGCCLDLIAGEVRRAPRWMQAAGLEWLFRLVQEPRRLAGRYATDAAWLARIVPGLITHRLLGSDS
jgi:exopolysaccharide biosynthesis WecB/TagA/CpsF family protein